MTSEARTTNPYHEARSIWNERYQNLVGARWNWQLIALVLALSNVVFALALVWHSAQSKVVPYIVRVDEAGQSLVIGPATASTIADPKIIGFQLQAYVRDLRQVTADGAAQKNLLERIYRQTAGPAISALNDHFRTADPFLAARSGTVMPSVRNTLQLGDRTWQVEWVEARRTLEGKLSGEETWVGQFEVVVEPPTAADELVANPLGFKVTRISWSRKFEPGGSPCCRIVVPACSLSSWQRRCPLSAVRSSRRRLAWALTTSRTRVRPRREIRARVRVFP